MDFKDKELLYQREYYQKNKDKIIARKKRWKTKNRERIRSVEQAYYQKNRERILSYDRKHELKGFINGKKQCVSGLNKRDYTGFCELCNKKQEYKLNYHHWDDNNLSKGVWVCVRCHTVCEGIDKNLVNKYLILKNNVNKEYENEL